MLCRLILRKKINNYSYTRQLVIIPTLVIPHVLYTGILSLYYTIVLVPILYIIQYLHYEDTH